MKLGPLFKELRKDLGLTQIQMAGRLKITQGAIAKIERGKHDPSIKTFIRAYRMTSKPIVRWDTRGGFDKILFSKSRFKGRPAS